MVLFGIRSFTLYNIIIYTKCVTRPTVLFTAASCGLEWRVRYQIIKGICDGLHYLHEQRIVHADLKPANILLDDNMLPRIADFGLSRCFDEDQTKSITSKLIGSM